MTYETVFELKEAGFPFRKVPVGFSAQGGPVNTFVFNAFSMRVINQDGVVINHGTSPDMYFEPTLSELIKQCGNQFIGLLRDNSGAFYALVKDDCRFINLKNMSVDGSVLTGPDPETALANLYISLSKKKKETEN